MSFEIKIPLFEGPFDLLLFFIQRDEIDIYDIPIYKITNDFMEYLSHLEQMNIEVASEFILMASTLMRIKAKMLLPRVEIDEEGNEIDPREELVKHLLEYKKYKSVIGVLEEWEGGMLNRIKRGNIPDELKEIEKLTDVEAELQDVTLYKLLRVYQGAMKRFMQEDDNPRRHEVVPYPYTLEGQKTNLLERLQVEEKIEFIDLIRKQYNKVAVVFNFLAVLELMSLNKVTVEIGEGYNNFWVKPYHGPDIF
ncbi:segregation and condensation protein A [Sediminitomix flava]|uniref:Segregation and condensation protein A n=1 Tax=Sediminitomix flava TaxID=379075 RepID=A0A315ZGV9_SEDFL|nr:segregation/condensation protein A [Sediminitomix flava]PWJ44360.1 condensin subunit ScpA [Sediminitomix flava]